MHLFWPKNRKLTLFYCVTVSSSQPADEFDNFLNKLNLTMESITKKKSVSNCCYWRCYFNAESSKWWIDDKTTQEGLKLESLLSQFSLSQVINEPTHISQNFNSCIDLLFTNQQNLITDAGIHPSLHSNCHHQIIYRMFNLKIFYPPSYERHIWHYKHANTDMISTAIQGFDWDKAFIDKSTEEKASVLLTKTILNIMSNFIPNEKITIDDRDPPWVNNKIKSLIKNKNEYLKNCVKPNNSESIRHFDQIQDTLRTSTEISKQNYYFKLSRKLAVNKINPKCYWSILKSFLGNKKIPCIPPLIHNNQFVVDFKEKSELFNSFFAKQCTYIETGSSLPTQLLRRTNESLNTINVMRKLDPSKAHRHDQIRFAWYKFVAKQFANHHI